MYPHERSFIDQTAGKPFVIIGVTRDVDLASIRKIAESKNLIWRSFYDGDDGPIAHDWCITAWPTTFLINAGGTTRYKEICSDQLDRAIKKLMSEMGKTLR